MKSCQRLCLAIGWNFSSHPLLRMVSHDDPVRRVRVCLCTSSGLIPTCSIAILGYSKPYLGTYKCSPRMVREACCHRSISPSVGLPSLDAGTRRKNVCCRGRAYDDEEDVRLVGPYSLKEGEEELCCCAEEGHCCNCLCDVCDVLTCSEDAQFSTSSSCFAAFLFFFIILIAGMIFVRFAHVSRPGSYGADRRSNSGGPLGTVERQFNSSPKYVDVVFMWVNGSHPSFQQKLGATQREGKLRYLPHAARFRDDGLLQYAVLSLIRSTNLLASVRNVYIVTSGEIPT